MLARSQGVTIKIHPIWTHLRPFRLVITAALLSLSAAGQAAPVPSGSPTTTAPSGSPAAQGWGWPPMRARSTDARFIVMMIPHHQGAIAMSELALTSARRPEIKALAQRIIASQNREIAQMRRWYRQWYGAEVPIWSLGSGYGMGMGPGMGMGWMGTSLEALKSAPDFDRAFIEQMIPHHRMGVMMASHAEWNTQHPELRQLEAAMVRVQGQEIEQMAQWYRQWYGSGGQ